MSWAGSSDGIYAGQAWLPDGSEYPAAISVGTKPTFGEHPRVCEAHLIGYDGPLDHYGWTIRLQFNEWLIGRGRVRDAICLLGHPYEIRAKVVEGDRRGRDLGIPTANLARIS